MKKCSAGIMVKRTGKSFFLQGSCLYSFLSSNIYNRTPATIVGQKDFFLDVKITKSGEVETSNTGLCRRCVALASTTPLPVAAAAGSAAAAPL